MKRLGPATAGATRRTTSTFLDLDDVAGGSHLAWATAFAPVPSRGVGVECQVTVVPAPFSADRLVESSRIVAVTSSALVPLLRHRRVLILQKQHGVQVAGGHAFLRPAPGRPRGVIR